MMNRLFKALVVFALVSVMTVASVSAAPNSAPSNEAELCEIGCLPHAIPSADDFAINSGTIPTIESTWNASTSYCCFDYAFDFGEAVSQDFGDAEFRWSATEQSIFSEYVEDADMEGLRGCGNHIWEDTHIVTYYTTPINCLRNPACRVRVFQEFMYMRCWFCGAGTRRFLREGFSHTLCV